MANYNTLISAIQSVIAANGNNEITGNILQQTLLSMISALGGGYQFAGIATPETTPGTPDEKIFYLGSSGTYPNFGPAVIPSGSMGVFYYDSSWHVGYIAFPLGDGSVTTVNIADNAVTTPKLDAELLNKLFEIGYKYAGVAIPSTNPGTPNQNVFYIVSTPGTYTNFDGIVVGKNEVAIIKYNGSWSKDSTNILSADVLDDLGLSVIPNPLYYTRIEYNINPSTGRWSNPADSSQGSKLFAIPIGTKKIILKPTSSIMMWSLLSAYTPAANNVAVSTATGTDVRYSASVETEIKNWSNAVFICVRADSTSAGAQCPEITFVLEPNTIQAQIELNAKDISDVAKYAMSINETYNLGSLLAGYVLDTGKWLVSSSDNTHLSAHYIIPVVSGRIYRIDASGLDAVLYWATSNAAAVNGQNAPIIGEKMIVGANKTALFQAPEGVNYLLIMAAYYTANIAPVLVANVASGGASMVDVIPDYIISGEIIVNLDGISQVGGIIGTGGTWQQLTIGKHKVIPVIAGEKYVIRGDGNGFWAWLSSSYSAPVVLNAAAPYATGNTNRILQKDAIAVTVPEGAAFLYISTVNGAGASSAWTIWKVASYSRRTVEMAKIRMVHWNIGQFIYTDWSVGDPTHTIPAADASEYAQKYRELFNSINADILGVAEYNSVFSAANWITKDVIFQCFRSIYEGTKRGASCNSLFSNIMEWVGEEEILFTVRQEQRYYTHLTARFMGENVHIVEAHLDHTYNEKRVAQIAQLIADMSPYRYVIIGGDFNTGDEETVETELAAFTNAGYSMLNDGYIGLVVTSLTEEYVDNIVTKGFAMSNIQVSQESGTLSDHLLISCELTMQGL